MSNPTDTKPLTLTEIAARIRAHLARFEADKTINAANARGSRPYYCVNAWRAGKYVGVKYISYQGPRMLDRPTAHAYLAWLDAGNVGRHYEVPKEKRDE